MYSQTSLPPATKLWQGNVFTGVCDSVHRRGSASVHAGIPPPPRANRHPPRADPPKSRPPPPAEHAERCGQCVGGTHPTGMQSCLYILCSSPQPITLQYCNSLICIKSWLFQNDSSSRQIACYWQEWSPESIPAGGSIHSQWTFFLSAGIVPVKSMEKLRTVRSVVWWQHYSRSHQPYSSRLFHGLDWYNSYRMEKYPLVGGSCMPQVELEFSTWVLLKATTNHHSSSGPPSFFLFVYVCKWVVGKKLPLEWWSAVVATANHYSSGGCHHQTLFQPWPWI